MANNSPRKPRCFSALPVWVVEDHNDALPHIYRAIASRHLPYKGVTMLHFDSHPDLQISTEMDADIVFDKYELFSSLSIENWIIPAVYAGHISGVVWIKPPWADQLPEGSRQVFVGKHKQSKKLRISWPDSYFLSDCLYAPKDDLECSKELAVDVVTMETDMIPTQPKASLSHQSDLENDKIRRDGLLESGQIDIQGHMTNSDVKAISCGRCLSSGKTSYLPLSETSCDSTSIELRLERKPSDCCMCICNRESTVDGSGVKSGCAVLASGETKRIQKYKGQESSDSGKWRSVYDVASTAVEKGSATVLDIDLDFFSTRNPFKEIYPESQFRQLEDLYSFEGPADDSESALKDFTEKRAVQLKELEIALRLAINGEEKTAAVSDERFCKVKSFVDALRVSSSEPLDTEMIHIAGLTCDDSGELPHHVSTVEEIDSLVVATETLLSRLPKPVMVTVARSSHDDYCPPEQVDQIQQKVLKMLQNTYGKLDVHLDYSNETDGQE